MTIKWAIDVSHYDAFMGMNSNNEQVHLPIDWARARDETDIQLAIIKASEGTGFVDPAFKIQWQAAGAAGLPRMAYHFFRANLDPVAQALFFWSIVEKEGFTNNDYVILDLETMDGRTGAQVLDGAHRFSDEMAEHMTVHAPLLYTYPSFWTQIGGQAAGGLWAKDYPLGIAQWILDNWVLGFPINVFDKPKLDVFKNRILTGELKPMKMKPWDDTQPALWQFTARATPTGNVAGYPGKKKVVDFNAVYMDLTPPTPPSNICPVCERVIPEKCSGCGRELP